MNPSLGTFRVKGMTTLARAVSPTALSSRSDAAESAVAAAGDMCRLVVIGPKSRVELAVPSHIPIAELLPTIVGHLDPALADRGLAHGGWVLQKLGHDPLDENRSTSSVGLLDGDVLYLRPRGDEMGPAQYDDLVDGVQSSLSARGDEWTAKCTRAALLVFLSIASLAATVVATTLGELVSIVALALAVACAGTGALVGRLWDAAAGKVLVLGAVGMAAVGGAALPAVLLPDAGDQVLVQAMSAAVAAGAIAAAGAYARGGLRPELLAIIGAAIVVVLALAIPVFFGLTAAVAAAITLLVLIAVARLIPTLSVWIAGLEIDPVPTSPEEFQTDLELISTDEIAAKAERVHAVAAAFWLAWAAVLCLASSVLTVSEEWASLVLVVVGSIATLLQARELRATVHRSALLVAAVLPLLLLLVVFPLRLGIAWQLAVFAVLVIVAAYAVVAVRVLPGRRLAPTWGRLGDNLHWACIIAMPALVLAVAGVYEWIADLF